MGSFHGDETGILNGVQGCTPVVGTKVSDKYGHLDVDLYSFNDSIKVYILVSGNVLSEPSDPLGCRSASCFSAGI